MQTSMNIYPYVLAGFAPQRISANAFQNGYAWNQAGGVVFDQDRWPKNVPSGQVLQYDFHHTPANLDGLYTGRFLFTARGTGRLGIFRQRKTASGWPWDTLLAFVDYRDGDVLTVDVPQSADPFYLQLRIVATDLDSDGNYLRKGRMVHENQQHPVLNDDFLDLHRGSVAVRGMEAQWRKRIIPRHAENAFGAAANDHVGLDHISWGGDGNAWGDRLYGMPDEAMMEMAAELGIIPQINLPANASDEWIRGWARMVLSYPKARVPRIFVGLGNETWLLTWEATQHFRQQTEALWPATFAAYPYDAQKAYGAAVKRMAEIFEIIEPLDPEGRIEFVWEVLGSWGSSTNISFTDTVFHRANPNHPLLAKWPNYLDAQGNRRGISRVQGNWYVGGPSDMNKQYPGGDAMDFQGLQDALLKIVDIRANGIIANGDTARANHCVMDVYEGGEGLQGHKYNPFRQSGGMMPVIQKLYQVADGPGKVDVFFDFADVFGFGGKYNWGLVNHLDQTLADTDAGSVHLARQALNTGAAPAFGGQVVVPEPVDPPVDPEPEPEPVDPVPEPEPEPQPTDEREAIALAQEALAARVRAL